MGSSSGIFSPIGFSATSEPFGQGAHRATEAGVTLPRPLRTAKPFYPRDPHDAWIQGVVGLELVVDIMGRAGDVRVVKSLHPDLDEARDCMRSPVEVCPRQDG